MKIDTSVSSIYIGVSVVDFICGAKSDDAILQWRLRGWAQGVRLDLFGLF